MKAQPQDLVTGGRFNWGRFDAPFRRMNALDAHLWGLPLPRAARWLRLKAWQAFQLATERCFINVALFNAKALALVQVKVFDRHTRRKHLYEVQVPPWSFDVPDQLLDSAMTWVGRDGAELSFRNLLEEDRVVIALDIPARGDRPRIKGEVEGRAHGWTPLVVAIPFGEQQGMTSHKGLMPAQGTLWIGEDAATFGPGQGYLLMDAHLGYYPYVMTWDWLTAACWRPDGKLVGLNLTRNASTDPTRYNENALWLDGRRHDLPPVAFQRHRDPQGVERWRIRDGRGRVDVTFRVEVPGFVDINALVIRSRYEGPFGTLHGTIQDNDGATHSIDGWFGMGERFYLRV